MHYTIKNPASPHTLAHSLLLKTRIPTRNYALSYRQIYPYALLPVRSGTSHSSRNSGPSPPSDFHLRPASFTTLHAPCKQHRRCSPSDMGGIATRFRPRQLHVSPMLLRTLRCAANTPSPAPAPEPALYLRKCAASSFPKQRVFQPKAK